MAASQTKGKTSANRKNKTGKRADKASDTQNGRLKKIFGLALTLIAIFLFFSFTSYLFNWKADQSTLKGYEWTFLMNNSVEVNNILGRLGAFTGRMFIFLGFGIASYLFSYFAFIWGINLLSQKRIFFLLRHFKYCLVLLLFLSVASSYIFQFSNFPWGGAVGFTVNNWLNGLLGVFGTGIFLFFLMLGLIVLAYNPNPEVLIERVKALFRKNETPPVQPVTEEQDTSSSPLTDQTEVKEWEEKIEQENEAAQQQVNEDESGLTLEVETGEAEAEEVEQSEEKDKVSSPQQEMQDQGDQQESQSQEEEVDLEVEQVKEEKMVGQSQDAPYDPTLDLPDYKFPPIDYLEVYGNDKVKIDKEELETHKNQIIETLNNYNIDISKIKATVGPTITLYEIVPAAGVRISKIQNLENDIALSLAALGIRIIAPIPGRGTVGIEVPNQKKEIVSMHHLIASEKFQNTDMELPVAIGKNISNEIYIADLSKMPHLLMAGATGQGKSVGLNAILVSLLYKKHPSELKFLLIDPKKVELSIFTKIEKHYLANLPDEDESIVTDTQKVVNTLNSLCIEMDQRYDLLKEAHVRNIKEYNEKFKARKLNPEKGHRFLPYIVLVIDEFADLMMTAGKEIETPISRLAQLARAIGIHLVIATQRPSSKIITGNIKANFPARIAFKVSQQVDSRIILDIGGAEQLIGRGDMLVSLGSDMERLQSAFVDTHEIDKITDHIGQQQGFDEPYNLPEYSDNGGDGGDGEFNANDLDAMFEDAARVIVQNQQGSTSLIQRRLKLGYNRAGRLMDQLEKAGVVGPHEGSKARDVLIPDEYELEQFLNNLP